MPDQSMHGWKPFVREQMKNLKLDPTEKEEVIVELSSHLEETCEGLCKQGLCESEALQRSIDAVDWQRLSRKIQFAKRKEVFMNDRTRQFWLPALVSLSISEGVLLGLSFLVALHAHLWQMGPVALYGPWLLSLPAAGAAAAYLSRRAGAGKRALLGAVWFPAIVGLGFIIGGLLIMLVQRVQVFAKPQCFYVSLALIVGVVLPCVALWLGSLPFLRERETKPEF